ncbi:uncharacterized protein LOC121177471 [Toxotes jaculatrix]|uniref:uncharacterized protein LOC121177471 n=1 Tax=Toxotes jaculatrix TaxID=941984 RepID=UPI001B3AF7FC|nr:uncharacterized protein LOC121177471 [Toxotes jaculatrix]
MERTLLCVLSLFFLNTLLYCGQAEDAELTLEPSSSYVFTGESVTFICDMREGNDTDWYYRFSWNGQQIVSFNPNNSYSLNLTADSGGEYQCTGRHKDATDFSKQSNKVTLHVSAHRPTATLTTGRTSIPVDGTLRMTCLIQGSDGWTYDWFRRTSDSHETMIVMDSKENFVSISHEGLYWCRGRRGNPVFFTKDSDMYRIERTLANRVSVTSQHNWTQIFSGEAISVRCEIQGDGDTNWEYEWRTTSSNTPPIHSEYMQGSASVSYSGVYWCKGRRDLYSSTEWSGAFTLTVSPNKPRPTVLAEERIIPAEGNITLTCYVVNSAEWKYYWFRRTSHTSEARTIRDSEPDGVISISQGGIYHCRGGRGDTAVFTEDSDAVTIEKRVSNKAFVSLQPNWPLIFSGETITVRCQIHGGGDTDWEYEWRKPKSNVEPTHNEYRIVSASVSNSGSYRCLGKDKSDMHSSTEWSNIITLMVSADRPNANLSADDRAFPIGGSVALTCSVNPSSSGWDYYWYRGKKTSEPLTNQDVVFHSSGQSISVSQEGLYWCRGGRGDPVYYTEYSGSVTIHKIVSNRPVVTLQTKWPKIYTGETIVLKCEIQGGDSEWEYEWTTTGSQKSSIKNEYRIGSASESDSGDYWCRGRLKSAQQNSTGWSASFNLVIYYAPEPVLTVSSSWLSPGDSVTLNCKVEHPSAGWRFYWYKAVPRLSDMYFPYDYGYRYWMSFHGSFNPYDYELLPQSSSGSEQDSYIVHRHTNTAGYVCRAGRGDPVYYTRYSEPEFVWCGDFHPAASLTVSPDRVQHFTSDSVSLSCEGNFTKWRVMFSERGRLKKCPSWGRMTGSTCHRRQRRNAVYWCESGSGEFSNAVNITSAYDNDVILVSPVHPVTEGRPVTLSCNLRTENLLSSVAFYKNGKLIQNDDRGQLNFSAVSKSDEGLYKCEYSGNESRESWMSVKSSRSSFPVSLISGLVSGITLIILLSLLLLCWYRKSKNPCCNRLSQSQRISQISATEQSVNQDKNQQPVYSSLLYGDTCVYESVRGSENTGDGGPPRDYRSVVSQIQLKGVGKRRNQNDPEEMSDYDNMIPDPAKGTVLVQVHKERFIINKTRDNNVNFHEETFLRGRATVSVLDVKMGHTSLCVLSLFLLNTLFYGKAEVSSKPTVALQPNWSQFYRGETITVRCEIHGGDTEWEYEWRTPSSNNPPSHSEYTISRAAVSDHGEYRCRGRANNSYTEWSEPITLSVSYDKPRPTLRSDTTIIPAGGSVTLTCSVENSADWRFDWFRRSSRSSKAQTIDGSDRTNRITEGGIYQCRGRRGSNNFFTENSKEVTIQKTARVTLTLQPNWSQIYTGETITVRCEIENGGDTEWTYEWRPAKLNSSPTHSEYRINKATKSHSGEYRCRGSKDYSFTQWSNVIRLTVTSAKPRASLTADRTVIPAGGRVTLTCSVSSSSGWKYYWYRDNKNSEPLNTQGKTFSVSQGGLYWCRGGRGDPVYYTEYSEEVRIDTIVSNRAVVSLQPNWSEIYRGETITVRCEIQGGDTGWTYEWTTTSSNKPPSHSEYTISKAAESHSGDYWCMGRRGNSYTEWSKSITLSISDDKPRPTLRSDKTTIPAGGSVTLTCSVRNSADWRFEWFRRTSGSSVAQTIDGSDQTNSITEGGIYQCRGQRGSNNFFTENSYEVTIQKSVSIKPTVTLQPNWPQIYTDERITVICEIQGGDTGWLYEWDTSSNNKPSNQHEYRISSASSSHSGVYRCRGRMKSSQYKRTEWSAPIKLTVYDTDKPLPVLTVSPSWLSPGDSVTLKCEVEHPSAGWRFYWYKAVPTRSRFFYSYKLLPGSSEQDSYIVHGPTHTAGYMCTAGRGDPVHYTQYTEPKFVWSGDFHPAASLTVSPDRVQHFIRDSVSLSCEGNSAEWRVMRFNEEGSQLSCSSWGRMTGSTCNVYTSRQSNSNGVYWCESGSGEFSNAVNITVQDDYYDGLILVSPVRPVTEGHSVLLGCRFRTENKLSGVFFYHNDKLIQSDTRGELIISAVSKSHEGFYKCQYSRRESAQSWMSVKVPVMPESSSVPVMLIVGLVCGLTVFIILLLLFYFRKFKDPCGNRLNQSHRENQGSATDQTVGHDENQQRVYSSLLHDDVRVYESIIVPENSGKGQCEDPEENSA